MPWCEQLDYGKQVAELLGCHWSSWLCAEFSVKSGPRVLCQGPHVLCQVIGLALKDLSGHQDHRILT